MRLIDADEAKKQVKQMQTLNPSERMLFRMALDRTPTYEPPNVPLTLEELREMDGEPAYFVNIVAPDYSFWGIVMVDNIFGVKKISTEGKTFCVHQEFLTDQSYGKFWLAYRRKPEEGN